ncbi:Gm34653 [Phodopus roborovskii]|uniref:Hexosyltransferase n=1 Tax=Phodopus roborovskii TaxID=109678 RepID=A0AAU9Z8S9_PHORO|nr:Gm34653 [Phodopus roborovskii]
MQLNTCNSFSYIGDILQTRTHQWCFILFNAILFHALLFGADFVEEYFLCSLPHVDMKILEIKNKTRKLNVESITRGTIFLLSLIFSSPGSGTRRELTRKTWGSVTSVQGYPILILQAEIVAASQMNDDIIEGIFLDSTENQTPKVISMTQWAVAFFPNALFILKADKKMFINLSGLVDYLLSLKEHLEGIYVGREFVPLSEYPEKYYQDYCSGGTFIMSQHVAQMVYVILKEAPIMVPAEVFVGIYAKALHPSTAQFIFTSSEATDAETLLAWREINDGKECLLFETYYGLISCKLLTYLNSFRHFHMGAKQGSAVHFGD